MRLGLPALEEAGLSSEGTQEIGQEKSNLLSELHGKSARDASTTGLYHPGRGGRSPAASRSRESKRSAAGAEDLIPPSAVLGGSLSQSKRPIQTARHGEGCEVFLSQKSF